MMDDGEKVGSRQMLGGQDSIQCLERELAPAVQKVGKMRLSKAGLASQ